MAFWSNFFKKKKREIKESAIQILLTPWGKVAYPEDRNLANYAEEIYLKNIIGFRCIDFISKSCASVEWKIQQKTPDQQWIDLDNHPFRKILKRPQPLESWEWIVYKTIAYLIMDGNAYLERVGPSSGPRLGEVKELYTHRPDRFTMEINKATGQISDYVYELNGNKKYFEVDPVTLISDILHLKLFHPTDDFYGTGPSRPASREIDTNNASVDWNYNLIENQARPGMILAYKENLDPEQRDRLKRDLKEMREGSMNAGKSLVLEGEVIKAEPYGFSPAEMDFIEGNRETSRRISYAYGVPPQLIGIPGDNTYSNLREARSACWEDTIVFYLGYFGGEMTNWMFGEQEIYLNPDLDNVPALAYKKEIQWDRAQKADFLTINEKRAMCGFEEHNDGDVLLVPMSMVPLGLEPDTDEGDSDEDEVPPGEEEMEDENAPPENPDDEEEE